MMRSAILSLLFVGFFSLSAAAETGNDLQAECDIVVRGAQTNEEGGKAVYCLGFVAGVLGMGMYLTADDRFCFPSGINKGQAVRIFLKYLKDNLSISHLPAQTLMAVSFREAWPCK